MVFHEMFGHQSTILLPRYAVVVVKCFFFFYFNAPGWKMPMLQVLRARLNGCCFFCVIQHKLMLKSTRMHNKTFNLYIYIVLYINMNHLYVLYFIAYRHKCIKKNKNRNKNWMLLNNGQQETIKITKKKKTILYISTQRIIYNEIFV